MLYRKAPPQPTRLLLRVVAVAGSGALLAAAACSSSSEGSLALGVTDGGNDVVDGGSDEQVVNGSIDGGSDLGLVTNPEGGDEHVVNGVVPGDASYDGPIVGVVVHPDGGTD